MLSEEVNDTTASLVVAQMLYLEAQDPDKEIQFYINSPGGSVSAGMAIYDTMNYIKCDVSTICIGMAASMGAFLLAAGAKGRRMALPNAEIMIHQPSAGTKGKVTDMEIDLEHFLRDVYKRQGPTSAFKDMALQMLPYLLTASLKKTGEQKTVCILVATSGDTGKAALEGFRDVPRTKILVFYPKDGVSDIQKPVSYTHLAGTERLQKAQRRQAAGAVSADHRAGAGLWNCICHRGGD